MAFTLQIVEHDPVCLLESKFHWDLHSVHRSDVLIYVLEPARLLCLNANHLLATFKTLQVRQSSYNYSFFKKNLSILFIYDEVSKSRQLNRNSEYFELQQTTHLWYDFKKSKFLCSTFL